MNAPFEPIAHAVRANVFEREVIWRLGPDALERQERGAEPGAGTPGRLAALPYASIAELRLSFAPSRFDRSRYRCDLTIKPRGTIAIPSTHYVSAGEFEDRSATYVPLVSGLVAQVAAANPACRFRAGKRALAYWLEHAFLLAMLLMLVLVLGLVGGVGITQIALIKLAILATYIPLMIRYTRKNWPRSFGPAAIPRDVLPDH